MIAISIRNASKKFRKVNIHHNYRTVKSLLIGMFTGARPDGKLPENSFTALNDVSLDIPRGETWGIIGRNGSGKSTLLKMIAGIYKPDEGDLEINGRVSALIELGAGFHPEFSGRENIFINASILGLPKKVIHEKFDEIVAFAELENFIDNPVRTYSSGMFMRLGFSVAIHVDPDILLVDEVLAVGDEAFGHKCGEKMDGFKRAGKTIILVTHNLAEVERWCDMAVWLDHGELKMIGKPNRVISEYLTIVAETENRAMLDKEAEPQPITEQTNRWGTGEAEITGVTLKDATGSDRFVYQYGDSVTVEIDYVAHQRLEEPVFGVAINRSDGGHCYGTNTDIEQLPVTDIFGRGTVAFVMDRLELVDGSYTLSVAIHAKDGHPYDYHDQAYEFSMRSRFRDIGVYRPPHRWLINGEALTMRDE